MEEIRHIVISLINDFYSNGNDCVIDNSLKEESKNYSEIESKIIKILDEKIRPAVAKDGGDINLKNLKMELLKCNCKEVVQDAQVQL